MNPPERTMMRLRTPLDMGAAPALLACLMPPRATAGSRNGKAYLRGIWNQGEHAGASIQP